MTIVKEMSAICGCVLLIWLANANLKELTGCYSHGRRDPHCHAMEIK